MARYGLYIAILFAFVWSCFTPQPQSTPPSGAPGNAQIPRIIVLSQPDSPLLVSTSTRWATAGREILDLYVVVTNRDAKSIRAYSTRIDFEQRKQSEERCLIEDIYAPSKVIKQEQKDGKSRFLGFEKNITPSAIQVSIDYVEFADGTAWGPDSCRSVEYLAGERAGGEAAIKWFRNLIKEKGTQAAVEALRSGGVSVEKPYNQSARWDEAFGRGIEIVGRRLMTAYQNEGEAEVDVTLSKPYDASGVRP